jgi:hypothetical protein
MVEADRNLIMKKISMIFPRKEAREILAILDRYGSDRNEPERERVQLAVLKLCEEKGDSDPAALVQVAKADYRDVLAWAEYPHQSKRPPQRDPEKRAILIARDREQYERWLKKS